MENLIDAQSYSRPAIIRLVGIDAADDVLQNAALKAWRFRDKFAGASKYETWFYAIAVREALMYKRKRADATGLELDAMIGDAPTPEEIAASEERKQRLYDAILSLGKAAKLAALRALKEEPIASNADKSARFHMRRKLREVLSAVEVLA